MMKTLFYKYPILFFSAVLLAGIPARAQEPEVPADSLKYYFTNLQSGSLYLTNYEDYNILYDPVSGQYTVITTINGHEVSFPVSMTQEEYKAYRLRRDMHEYYKSKIGALSKKSGDDKNKKDLLPKYYVNSDFFETVFGGNEITVNMQGNIELKMGVLHQEVDNPNLNETNRSNTIFDFDQNIGASIMANVGKRVKISANYDTKSTFDFQNLVKMEFDPSVGYDDDGIIRKIEVGNVSMPMRSSLIQGAQNLFGMKTELQFGRTTVSAVYAKQQSQSKTVQAEGGSVVEEFELQASDYDPDRHFFLSQYFRNHFDEALLNYPLVNSPVQITNIEVWITNSNNTTENLRNIVALADMAEPVDIQHPEISQTSPYPPGYIYGYPDNHVNELYQLLQSAEIRDISTVSSAFANVVPASNPMIQGKDYSVLENARRLVEGSDFYLDRQLGFISLNRRLNDSEVLAVAYEYTINGSTTVYKVGEMSSDGIVAPDNLVVKLLRPELINTTTKVWDLMMKNIYNLQAYQLNKEGFRLELLYENDESGVPLNVLQTAVTPGVSSRSLLNLFYIDRLDQNDISLPEGDGYFDYVEGITVFSQKGYIMFPKVEPFGSYIDGELQSEDDGFVFNELYEYTQQEVKNNYQAKDKYLIKGYYKSDSANGISLGAFNVPQGSVHVTSGGRELVEGVDYVVDYQIGRVKIINPAIEASNAPIQVSVEQNTIFSQQRTSFLGVDVAHKISENFVVGASYLRLSETPFTQKVNFGQEPLQNQIFGMNAQFSTESAFLSKIANRLPFHKSDAPSNFSIRSDVAYLMPGTPKRINVNGEAASYIDDFEGTQTPMNIRSYNQWFLASTPQEPPGSELFDLGGNEIGLGYGKKRARLAWYNIDRDLYNMSSIDNDEKSRAEVRVVLNEELFPEQEQDFTDPRNIRTLDLAYFPHERGSYNYDIDNLDADGRFTDPEDRWGGIMRAMTVTDFDSANIEYLQFWIMDPFENYSITQEEGLPPNVNPGNPNNHQGEIYINLGNISEDILKDNRKAYENGLPVDGTQNTAQTFWGIVPTQQAVLYAFDNDDNHRALQDIGLDGLDDEKEKNRTAADFPDTPEGQQAYNDYQAYINYINGLPDNAPEKNDPANDNFRFYKSTEWDDQNASILLRYKNFSRTQGNAPTASMSTESYPTAATQYPDIEDINKDQTMNTVESFYQYKISLNPADMTVGQNYIVDKRTTTVTLANGQEQTSTWYQFRIPIASGEPIGGINGFNSIRFMRIFLTKFKMPVVIRFAQMELVRGQWRRYKYTLEDGEQPIPPVELDNFESGVVNIEENSTRQPIPYVLPPGIVRERLQGTTRTALAQNEQSLSLVLRGVEAGDGRALFKNVSVDLRMFKRLKMFIHAESKVGETPLNDDELVAVIRLGSDLSNNYYQIEKPLKITPFSSTTAESIWPAENELNVDLDALKKLKLERYDQSAPANQLFPAPEAGEPVAYRTRVLGHPNLGKVKVIMLGIMNKSGGEVYGEIWFNELRASGYDNEGGWASIINADGNITDIMDFSFTGRMSTRGYGNVDQNVNERSQEDIRQYDIATNLNVGKFAPDNWGLQIPLNIGFSEEIKQSKYDAQYQDILLEDTNDQNSPHRNDGQDYTRRRSISLINVKKNHNPDSKRRQQFYDFENLSFSYAYNELFHRDYNVEKFSDRNVRAAVGYNYSFKALEIAPFKKLEALKGKSWKFIKDINFNPLPTTISANTNIIRQYNEQLSRSLVDDLPPLPVLKQRNFLFDWDYTVGFKPFQSLRINFNATNHRVYDDFSYYDDIGLYDNFFNPGRPVNYNHKLDASYQIPIDKLPLLDFIKSNYSYNADFDWQGASHSIVQFPGYSMRIDQLTGNTIQNANSHNFQMEVNMKKFYKNIGIAKVLRTKKERKAARRMKEKQKEARKKTKEQKGGEGEKPTRTKEMRGKSKTPYKPGKPKTAGAKVARVFYDLLTSLKNVKLNYQETNGTVLPGYAPETGFLGRDDITGTLSPTLGFVFGSQVEMRNYALEHGWLVGRNLHNPADPTDDDPYYNRIYARNHFEKLDVRATVTPFKNFDIDILANRTYTGNISEQMDVIYDDDNPQLRFNPGLTTENGNFSMSYFMLNTYFDDIDKLFDQFKANRNIIAQRLLDESETPGMTLDGFGPTSQQVVLPAFLSAYSGKSASNIDLNPFAKIPLPNWSVRFRGLMKLKWFKKHFKNFSISHGYRSSYSILNYQNNMQYDPANPLATDNAGNYLNEKLYTNVSLLDEFSPLVKVDVKLKNSFSFDLRMNSNRMLTLNMNNNTLSQNTGQEYVLGLGYRIKKLPFKMKLKGNKMTFKGDLNMKLDLSMRKDKMMVRYFGLDNNTENDQITGGQTAFGIKFIADYAMTKNLQAGIYYIQDATSYEVSTSFDRRSISSGISIKYTLGN